MAGKAYSETLQSVETTFQIVAELESSHELGVSAVANQLDLPVSTVYVHLNTLRELGYVIKTGTKYRLGYRFLRHAGAVRKQLEIDQVVRDEISKITNVTGEVTGFGIEENGKRVIVYRSKSSFGLDDNVHVGEYTPLYWTAIGKAIFAHLSEDRRRKILEEQDFEAATENTITDEAELRKELSLIRERGYALDDEERRNGIRGVAVPIVDVDRTIVGAIGTAGPRHRFTAAYLAQLLQVLLYRKNVIELRHNYDG